MERSLLFMVISSVFFQIGTVMHVYAGVDSSASFHGIVEIFCGYENWYLNCTDKNC